MYREKKIQIPFEISREFFPAVGSTGKISVHYDQPLCFAFVLKGRGSSGYEKLFKGFLHWKARNLEQYALSYSIHYIINTKLSHIQPSSLALAANYCVKQVFYFSVGSRAYG